MSHSVKIVEDKKLKIIEEDPYKDRKKPEKTTEIINLDEKKEIFDEKNEKKYLEFSSGK
jgi:hypothetical protein